MSVELPTLNKYKYNTIQYLVFFFFFFFFFFFVAIQESPSIRITFQLFTLWETMHATSCSECLSVARFQGRYAWRHGNVLSVLQRHLLKFSVGSRILPISPDYLSSVAKTQRSPAGVQTRVFRLPVGRTATKPRQSQRVPFTKPSVHFTLRGGLPESPTHSDQGKLTGSIAQWFTKNVRASSGLQSISLDFTRETPPHTSSLDWCTGLPLQTTKVTPPLPAFYDLSKALNCTTSGCVVMHLFG